MRWTHPLCAAALLAALAACDDSPTGAAPEARPPAEPMAVMNPTTSRVVGYFPTWTGSIDSIPYSKLTHINYAFVLPTTSGGLTGVAMSGDTRLQGLVQRAHNAGVKVLISIGGWNNGDDSGFVGMAASSTARSTFVNNVISFVTNYGLDGVDIDWEYPDPNTSEATNYTTLMGLLSTEMHNRGKLLTAAVVAQGSTGAGIQSTVFSYVDYLVLMAYDGGTPHSPYSYAVTSLDYWAARGLSQSKTVLGVPFYGSNSSGTQTSYRSIVAADANAPNADYSNGYYYNGTTTIRQKTALSLQRGTGVGIWELTQDTNGTTSLLNAIQDVMNGATVSPPSHGVYADALSPEWEDWSWDATVNFAATSPVQAGTKAIGVTITDAWGALYLHHAALSPYGLSKLEFYIHGGTAGGQQLVVYVEDTSGSSHPQLALDSYVVGGSVAAGTWRKVSIPLSSLGVTTYAITEVAVMDDTGGAQPTFYVDGIQFVP
ncbi:MAG TPA: glycosyl hydrolase family 18 protein [Longimicrobium sp.]|nr:glycosyl hydrolase family 18 protein [Longimicrobium sp.]